MVAAAAEVVVAAAAEVVVGGDDLTRFGLRNLNVLNIVFSQ